MEIGNNDLDFIDDEYGIDDLNETVSQEEEDYTSDDQFSTGENNGSYEDYYNNNDEDDFITELLKTRGIEDKTKIKFENDEGELEEVDWNSLSNNDRLNILNSSNDESNQLDDSEIDLINAIRHSRLTPNEYLQAVQNHGINSYIQNAQEQSMIYRVDEISDEELFISDLLSRIPDMTNEEAIEALDRAKQNDALFNKQIGALRAEYKQAEEEALHYQEIKQQQEAQAMFNQFTENIENSIINFTEFSGCDINMDQEDMQELYDFITGTDAAGVSHFGKVLNDPEWLVRMAWFALNGEQMINDISEYYKKEIASVRKESYNKGLQASKDKSNIVHKPVHKSNKSNVFDDLDEFN